MIGTTGVMSFMGTLEDDRYLNRMLVVLEQISSRRSLVHPLPPLGPRKAALLIVQS